MNILTSLYTYTSHLRAENSHRMLQIRDESISRRELPSISQILENNPATLLVLYIVDIIIIIIRFRQCQGNYRSSVAY